MPANLGSRRLTYPHSVLLPPYDHPTLWEGASSIVDEILEQLPKAATPPHAIIGSVGGGSLLGGLLTGCDRHHWNQS